MRKVRGGGPMVFKKKLRQMIEKPTTRICKDVYFIKIKINC